MAKSFGPNTGLLVDAAQGEAHYAELMKQWRGMDTLLMPAMKGVGTNAPPGSPADGDAYVIGTSPTAAWAGQGNKIARWSSIASAWEFFTARTGWSVRDGSSVIAQQWFFNGTAWQTINIRLSSGFGLVIPATSGTTYDLYLQNVAQNAAYMQVLAGSNIPQFPQGINLGGTASLSAYDEGTWTPTAANLGGSGIGYATKYVRAGGRTDFSLIIAGTSLSCTTASTSITLPFTPARLSTCGMNDQTWGGVGNCLVNVDGKLYLPTCSGKTQLIISGTIFNV
ncbi:DUF2793 domain-containing protein [Geothrix sp. PMB-07]|uniref:DUF2793 domain-containing protein n=1 Tax=Geothrix sp. PMB-07 TaxID=3068640 RepID=UPI002740E090|nr:DUF2793 domain-containing protein [Geothrix sp. PMB-07]WLT32832.1 DUF2793 domain-containing protein [Geothrix sp. PMB-07]